MCFCTLCFCLCIHNILSLNDAGLTRWHPPMIHLNAAIVKSIFGCHLDIAPGHSDTNFTRESSCVPDIFLSVLSYRKVSQFTGSLNWASSLIPLGGLYIRPLQRHILFTRSDRPVCSPCQSDPIFLATLLRQ